MSENLNFFTYSDDGVSFTSSEAAKYRRIYMPLCGGDASSLKSAITPYLSGDSKIDKFSYLTKPTSTEDLRSNMRDFFFAIEGKGVVSAAQESHSGKVEAGQLWHKLIKEFSQEGVSVEVLNFVPCNEPQTEVMKVTLRNEGTDAIRVTPTSSIPLFARSLANKHDHEHVTSLLHRTKQIDCGVIVHPPMAFNEEGHKVNELNYYVFGIDQNGHLPIGSFPTFDSFFGENGTLDKPQAIYSVSKPKLLDEKMIQGKEVVGALRFQNVDLKPNEEISYIVAMGISNNEKEARSAFENLNSVEKFESALQQTKDYWQEKVSSIDFQTGDYDFNAWMKWVTLQPVLRRIYGCSFLPDHDYGKGGKGWRDIWQDLLALILIEPKQVRDTLINNYAGVRIDGSNATIIGTKPGEFIADRNAITRVWMDHGAWPYATTLLYINQTGDFDLLFETNSYFRDAQLARSSKKDENWTSAEGQKLKDVKGNVYEGSLLEHIILQNIVPFFNVGEHNISRLESADWNDGLDMASKRGESVAFASFYAGNLISIASLLETLKNLKGIKSVKLFKELLVLLDRAAGKNINYDDWKAKQSVLTDEYYPIVSKGFSGDVSDVAIDDLISDLKQKGESLFAHINAQEKISVDGNTWFNGYYDNKAERVEGKKQNRVWMTLTGQVFPVMSGLASEEDVKSVVKSVDQYLKDPELGGYRLNTDFGLPHYLDLGRAFGFAFGTKENGAFFSHMIVMYGYALYARGFAREGYKVLNSIYNMSIDGKRAQIYPGVPEYFDSNGRGMYHYLTGSASWFVLTELVQVFGVKGSYGDLLLEPKLVKEQFSKEGMASVSCQFASKKINVIYKNPNLLDYGQYKITSVTCDNQAVDFRHDSSAAIRIDRAVLSNYVDSLELTVNLSS